MNYYFDTEFFERSVLHDGKLVPMIDMISISIVDKDGNIFYAISNEFDVEGVMKDDWLVNNVIKTLIEKFINDHGEWYLEEIRMMELCDTEEQLRIVIQCIGISMKEIGERIKKFIYGTEICNNCGSFDSHYNINNEMVCNTCGFVDTIDRLSYRPIKMYAYCGSTDFINFYRTFDHKLLNIPKHFPYFFFDLKSMLWEKFYNMGRIDENGKNTIKSHPMFPINNNPHDPLEDSLWNKRLHQFIIEYMK